MSGNSIEIEGKRYRMAHRRANMGELVYIISNQMGHDLDICAIYTHDGRTSAGGWHVEENDGKYRDYVVLEHLEETPDINDLLANLARRVQSLEQQLRDTQGNVEKLAEELANTRHRITKHAGMFGIVEERVETLTSDIITLDERSQVLNAINKFYEEGGR
jgi:hypothetical protein